MTTFRVSRGHFLERGFDLSGAASPRTVHDGGEHGDPSRPVGIKVRGRACLKQPTASNTYRAIVLARGTSGSRNLIG